MATPDATTKLRFYNLRRGDAPELALSADGRLPPEFDHQCALLGTTFYNNLPSYSAAWRDKIMKKVVHIELLTQVNNWLAL